MAPGLAAFPVGDGAGTAPDPPSLGWGSACTGLFGTLSRLPVSDLLEPPPPHAAAAIPDATIVTNIHRRTRAIPGLITAPAQIIAGARARLAARAPRAIWCPACHLRNSHSAPARSWCG